MTGNENEPFSAKVRPPSERKEPRTNPMRYVLLSLLSVVVTFSAIALREDRQKPPQTSPCGLSGVPCEYVARLSFGDDGAVLREVTAYTSRFEETDDTPCESADGSDICRRYADGEDLCAANFVPFGTVLGIGTDDDGSPSFTCTVADRTSEAQGETVDLYMGTGRNLGTALEWGRKTEFVTVFSKP